ncbi:complex I intermediate-associated protein CIA30 [Cylindrobasidium torrendii FP15055 ss-10]|uniref:Complex I intermediate-associated protein CIA30 n=1 Tax=Cylindrobasidium torrendii FP15055 ss-10 TaxID=1314674 RepID=A0A0D7B1S1_9AGAR|nr:complex I intermediate-associated protein CIA30 [Cylindrobasidium torrendii FP15055 ss-10]
MSRLATWSKYWARTGNLVRQNASDMIHMRGTLAPDRSPRTLFSFNDIESVRDWKMGCDGDMGGKSTVHFDLDTSPEHNAAIGKPATGRFWGKMSTAVQPQFQGKTRGGWAGIQNKKRGTLFGELMEEIEFHDYLALRVRAGGDPDTRAAYFVNLQTESDIQADIWQHRLLFRRKDNGWEDLYLPFNHFVRTNHGQIAARREIMNKSRLKSVNIAILGGHCNASGNYELGIDSIRIVNEEDVKKDDAPPNKNPDNEKGDWEDLPDQERLVIQRF